MNNNRPFSFLVVCLLILPGVNKVYAQGCCGIGGSLVSGGHPVLNKNTFLVSTSGSYADADNPERYRGSTGVLLGYGITDRLSLSLKTSYVWARYTIDILPIVINGEQLLAGKTVHYKNRGFGDGYAALQFALIKLTPVNKQELIVGADMGIPWGPDRKTVDGIVLTHSVQTGTGGLSLNGFLTYLKAFPNIYYSVASTIAGRMNFETRSNKDPGDEFSVMVTSLLGPFFETRGSFSLSYYQNGMTYDLLFKRDEISTSGKRLSLVPNLEHSITPDLKVSVSADIPLWRDRNQTLLGNDKVLKAEIYWFIH